MKIFGSGQNDNLPGQPARQVTAVARTDKQGCYNPQYPGAPVAVTFSEDDWDDQPHALNITAVVVTYVPGPDGAWVAEPNIRIDVERLDGPSIWPVFQVSRADPYPPWLREFIDTARPQPMPAASQ